MKKLSLLFLTVCMILSIVACTPTPPEHVHDEQKFWSKDATNHWKECRDSSCKEIVTIEAHDWEETRIVREPTPTLEGKTEFTCKVCKQTKTENVAYVPSAVVTSAEWDQAVVIKDNHIFTLHYKMVTASGEETERTQETAVSGDAINIANVVIYVKDGDNFYKYTIERKDVGGGFYSAKTFRQSTTEGEMRSNKDTCSYLAGKFSSFEFDSENGVYTCDSLEISGTTITNIKLTFADGKLIKYYYEFVRDGVNMYVEYSYRYETYQISIPQDFIDLDQANDQGGEGGEGGSQDGDDQNGGNQDNEE